MTQVTNIGLQETILESIKARKAAPAVTVTAAWVNWLTALIEVEEVVSARDSLNRELSNWLNYDQKGWFL